MKLGIDLQHNGKPDKLDLGGNHHGYHEYEHIAPFGFGLLMRSIDHGHRTFINGMGSYSDRAKRFNTFSANLVVLCHANAGGGSNGRIFLHPSTSKLNVRRANRACEYLDSVLPWKTVVKTASGASLNVQKGYKAWTWCAEPFFFDNFDMVTKALCSEHESGRRGLESVGAHYADAINEAYAK